jgi:hypothetical protein
MNWTTGSKLTSATGLATCSVLAILAASWPARAQTCPTGKDVPRQTIKIYNDTTDAWIFPELEVGLNKVDNWIQYACKITQKQADEGFNYATTITNRFYINGTTGIAPGGNVVIALPLYTQLASTVNAKEPNQYAEWWQGENMQIFISKTRTPPSAYTNYFTKVARKNQKTLDPKGPVDERTLPTCTGTAPCTLTFVTDPEGTLPKFGPSQLVEATLGASQVQKVVNGSLPKTLNVTQSDMDVSYVNVAYFAAAVGPVDNDQAGYVGSPMSFSVFQSKLDNFQKKFDWPKFVDLDGTKAAIQKLPSTLELMARLDGANAPTDISPLISNEDWKNGKVWKPIEGLKDNWAAFTNPSKCKHSTEGFTTFCDAILDVKDIIHKNYLQYRVIYPTKCGASAKPVDETPNLTLAHVYGWTPWIESGTGPKDCISPTDNLLENTPGYAANEFELYAKVKLEFDQLNYGTYTDTPSYPFNPWVQFIHGRAVFPDQLSIDNAYAYSVDDAVGNLNVAATGYIVDIGSTEHLEGDPPTPAQPPLNIQLGYAPDAPVNFVHYQVCKNTAPLKNVNPADPAFIISAVDPKNCPVYLYDNKASPQAYTFTVTTKPPFTEIPTADVRKNLASWSSGNGNPTKYNTTFNIDCSGNKPGRNKPGLPDFKQSSKAWCCTLLIKSGNGVFAYSTPFVPPTAHTLLSNIVSTVKAEPEPTSNAETCNMGKPD